MFRIWICIFITSLVSIFGCQNGNQSNVKSGGVGDLPCDAELTSLDLKTSPFSLDSLVKIEFSLNQDSITEFRQFKSMYYSLDMTNCEVNKSEINFNLLVVYRQSKQYYHLTVKKLKNGTFKVINKTPLKKKTIGKWTIKLLFQKSCAPSNFGSKHKFEPNYSYI